MESGAKALRQTVFAVEHAFVDAVRDEVDTLFHDDSHDHVNHHRQEVHFTSITSSPPSFGNIRPNRRRTHTSRMTHSTSAEALDPMESQYPYGYGLP